MRQALERFGHATAGTEHRWGHHVVWLWVLLWCTASVFLLSTPAQSQPQIKRSERDWQLRPEPPESREPRPEPRWVLPPLPPLSPRDQRRLPGPRVFVRRIIVTGSTVFAKERLDAITDPYVNREVSSEELESLRVALSRLYADGGYINSGAVLPDQRVRDGIIRIHIIEGELTDVVVTENKRFRKDYLRDRLTLDVAKPLNIQTLQKRLRRLQQDSRIRRLQAELRPGLELGQSELHVRVEETLPYIITAAFNNYQASTIGSERGLLTLGHRNVTGRGDIFRLTTSYSEGTDLQLDASYSLPLNPRDTTLNLRYRRNDSSVIEEAFRPLGIESRSEIFSVTLRHPVYRSLRRELAFSISGERLHSDVRSELVGNERDDEFFPDTTITALRFTAEWLDRTSNQVLAVRSRFSLGVDALGAAIDASMADEPATGGGVRFTSWLGQFQLGRRLSVKQIELRFRFDIQLTTEPLVALERIAIGGRFSVRGYRENLLVRDQGALVSFESRIPLLRNHRWAEYLQVVPFFDVGWGWQRQAETPSPKYLASIGLGLRWAASWASKLPVRSEFELFWGYRLRDVENTSGNLQDHGLHLQLAVTMF